MNNFIIALEKLDEEWFATLPEPEEVPEFEVSKHFLRWEQRVIYGKKSTASKAVKVVLIAAALIILLSVIALSTTKGREFFMQFFNESAVFSLYAEKSEKIQTLEIGYIPENFELDNAYDDRILCFYHYSSEGQEIEIQKQLVEITVDFNKRSSSYERINRDGIIYHILLKEGKICNVFWNQNNYYYQVSGNINKEEALKIAYGVR